MFFLLKPDIKLAEEKEVEKLKKMERFEKITRLIKENSEREKLTEKSIETKNPSTWEVRKENPKIKELNKFRKFYRLKHEPPLTRAS